MSLPQRACGTPWAAQKAYSRSRPSTHSVAFSEPVGVVQAGVNDAAVVGAGRPARAALPLQQAHRRPPLRPAPTPTPARSRRRQSRPHRCPPCVHYTSAVSGPPCVRWARAMYHGMFVTVPLLDLNAQYSPLRTALLDAVTRVCDSQRFIGGPEVEGLERELAAYLETPHAHRHVVGHRRAGGGADGPRHRSGRRGHHADLFVLRDRRRGGARWARRRCWSTSTPTPSTSIPPRRSRPSRREPRRSSRCTCSASRRSWRRFSRRPRPRTSR